jgi:hypothetical protein
MKSDAEIRDDVMEELRWDPQIPDPDAIGVAVRDGSVTLTGHASSYAEKLAAARAVERVYGVKAVANDLKVRLSGAPRDDSDIARAIAHGGTVLQTSLPHDAEQQLMKALRGEDVTAPTWEHASTGPTA